MLPSHSCHILEASSGMNEWLAYVLCCRIPLKTRKSRVGSVSEPLSKNGIFKTLFLLRSIPSLKTECNLKIRGTEPDRRLTHFSPELFQGHVCGKLVFKLIPSPVLSCPFPSLSFQGQKNWDIPVGGWWLVTRRRNEKIKIQNNRLFVGLAPFSVLFFTFQLPALILIVWRPALSLVFIYFRVLVASFFLFWSWSGGLISLRLNDHRWKVKRFRGRRVLFNFQIKKIT